MALGVILLILLGTSLCANSDNEGPSDVLKKTWSQMYMVFHQHHSPRCSRSCDQDAVNVYWNANWGHDMETLTKSEFLESRTDAYTKDKEAFVNSFRKNITLGVLYLDADHNGIISAEEFYIEYLCVGFELERIKNAFEVHQHDDDGILVSNQIESLVELYTDANETNEMYQVFEEEVEYDLSSNADLQHER